GGRAASFLREILVQKRQEALPVRGRGCMRPRVIVPAELSRRNRRVERRQPRGAQILLAKQTVDRTRRGGSLEFTNWISPLIGGAAGDVHRSWSTERNQHVGIHGHLVPSARPLLEVASEPPREVLGHVVDRLAPVATRECGAISPEQLANTAA